MSKEMKLINTLRIWSFVICFASGGILILGHYEFFGVDRVMTDSFTKVVVTLIRVSIPIGIVTTFIVLIDSAGDGLNALQRKKDEKNKKKRH